MAAVRFSSDVLQMFYGPIPREENRNLPEPLEPDLTVLYDVFQISQNNFQELLRVWRMDVSERNPNNKDLLRFARADKEKYTDLIKQEILKLGSVKVSFGLQVKFSIERNDEKKEEKHHYFHEKQPHVFSAVMKAKAKAKAKEKAKAKAKAKAKKNVETKSEKKSKEEAKAKKNVETKAEKKTKEAR